MSITVATHTITDAESVPCDPELIYRWEVSHINSFLDMAEAERESLIEKARQQDNLARENILCALLKMVVVYATRMRRDRAFLDFFELASVGNFALVEYYERALLQPNPWAYLLKCARLKMLEQFNAHAENCITTPRTESVEPYEIIPLNPGLDEIDFDLPEPPLPIEKDYSALYRAIQTLPERTNRGEPQREIIFRLFGLCGFSCESMAEVAGVEVGRTSGKYYSIKSRRNRALQKLQKILAKSEAHS